MRAIFLSIFIITLLGGCATGAKREQMQYVAPDDQPLTFDEKLKNNTSVETVEGGEETNPVWTSEISDTEFEAALKLSLEQAGLLKQGGRYKLNVTLEEVDQPIIGIGVTVTTHVFYRLIDSDNDSVVYEKRLVTPYTASFSDAFYGPTRLRLANEGAGKENIKALINDLSELEISSSGIEIN